MLTFGSYCAVGLHMSTYGFIMRNIVLYVKPWLVLYNMTLYIDIWPLSLNCHGNSANKPLYMKDSNKHLRYIKYNIFD